MPDTLKKVDRQLCEIAARREPSVGTALKLLDKQTEALRRIREALQTEPQLDRMALHRIASLKLRKSRGDAPKGGENGR